MSIPNSLVELLCVIQPAVGVLGGAVRDKIVAQIKPASKF